MSNLSVIGLQWGDEGKGKIVDCLSQYVDAVVRFQGGNNAGHTIVTEDGTYKLNLLPSGIIRKNVLSIIEQGVVVDPYALLQEISKLNFKITADNLIISENCQLIFSWHRELDILYEKWRGNNKIGTTGKGIGPCYEDKVARRGLRISDIYNKEQLSNNVDLLLHYHNSIRTSNGMKELTKEQVIKEIKDIADILKPYVVSTNYLMQVYSSSRMLFEGAQGALLDINYGTYPFVTSSSTININQLSNDENYILGVSKAYTTRVGNGVFPTEQNNDIGNRLQEVGKEIGTVSGRTRRCGWFDAALISYSIKISQAKSLALTKLDVLDGMKTIKICTHYQHNSTRYNYLPTSDKMQKELQPIYEELPGWQEKTAGITDYKKLPKNAKAYVKKIEELLEIPIVMISTGAHRNDLILLNE